MTVVKTQHNHTQTRHEKQTVLFLHVFTAQRHVCNTTHYWKWHWWLNRLKKKLNQSDVCIVQMNMDLQQMPRLVHTIKTQTLWQKEVFPFLLPINSVLTRTDEQAASDPLYVTLIITWNYTQPLALQAKSAPLPSTAVCQINRKHRPCKTLILCTEPALTHKYLTYYGGS